MRLRFKILLVGLLPVLLALSAGDCAVMLSAAAYPAEQTSGRTKQRAKKKLSGKKGRQSSSKNKKPQSRAADEERSSGDVRREQKRNSAEMQQTRKEIALNTRETERRLNDLALVEGEIGDCNRRISVINQRIDSLNGRVLTVGDSIGVLDSQIATITRTYAKALRRSQGKRSQTSKMAFLLSSKSFAQAYRRMNAVRQVGKWRKKKEEEIAGLRQVLQQRRSQLESLHAQSARSARELGREKTELQKKQNLTAQLVDSLKGRRAELDEIMAQRARQAAALDAELDRIITREAAEAARREAERKERIEAERRAREEAQARQQAEAEAKAREAAAQKARAEAEASERAREAAKAEAEAREAQAAKARAEEAAARKRSKEEARQAEKQRREAEAEAEKARKEQLAAEEKARRVKAAAEERARKEEAARKEKEDKEKKASARSGKGVRHKGKNNGRENRGDVPSDVMPDGGAPTLRTPSVHGESGTAPEKVKGSGASDFESCRGSLPMPVAGRYTIVKRFGHQPHPTLPHVQTDNAGIDLQTAPGAPVRAVFDGEVSAVFRPDGYNNVVVIRHGNYLTVYANLGQISVSAGQQVKAGQNIGTVFSDPNDSGRSVLHFEVRHGRAKENPELWLRR